MSCFEKVAADFGLTEHSQGVDAFVHLILAAANAGYGGSDVFTCPYSETIRRLALLVPAEHFALKAIKEKFNSKCSGA